jgi:hypothetical protein
VSVDAQLASGNAPVLALVELGFTTGTARLTNWAHPLPFAGYIWDGIGALGSISVVKSSERLEYPSIDLVLYPVNDALMALLQSEDPSTYRGRPVTIYQAVLDDELRPLGVPELAWFGQMSQPLINTGDGEGDTGSIVMRCELYGRDNRSQRSLRLNHAQHSARHPGDTFFSRIEELTGRPVPWLSRRFQEI